MLEYRIQKTESPNKKRPALFLIHGYGSNADDLFSFAPYLPKNHTIIALQAPLSLGNKSFAWYPLSINTNGEIGSKNDTAWAAVDTLIKNIDELTEKYALNPKDISLLGFSQGSILSWALGYRFPDKIRRVIALSGFIHESINTTKEPEFIAYAAHGTKDEVIPVFKARESILPLSKKYSEIQYHEYPDGHTISQENFTALIKWLNKTNL